MKPDFRKTMIWLHTYVGLVFGWLLFAIFATGTLSYFNPEITQWMKPELVKVSGEENTINRSLEQLHLTAKDASSWRIYLPNKRTQRWYIEYVIDKKRTTVTLAPTQWDDDSHEASSSVTQIRPRDSAGGNFFRTFHYTLQLRGYGGRYIAGIAAMAMLVALFSGIYTHRRFIRDFFTLRFKTMLKALGDAHALAGIITIPFVLMICTSGIMIYVIMYMPFSANLHSTGERALSRALSPGLEAIQAGGKYQAPLSDFSIVQKQIQTIWRGNDQVRRVSFDKPFNEHGRIIVDRVKNKTVSRQSERLVFSSVTGKRLDGYPSASLLTDIRRVFFGLHEAHFAQIWLRWLLFVLGIISSALIATGSIIWISKRIEKAKKLHLGHTIVARLNVAGISGLMVAIAVYFAGNRLLPLSIVERAEAEVQVFLCAWFLCLIHAIFRPSRNAWIEQLTFAGLIFISLPIIDIYLNKRFLVDAFASMNTVYITFTFALLLMGVALLNIAILLHQRKGVSR